MQKLKKENKSLSSYLLNKKKNQEKLLVAFLPANYPDRETSLQLINYLLKHGVDALELGFPALDASKDGKTIVEANRVVIGNGFKAADYFSLAKRVNQNQEYNRIAAMGYWDSLKADFAAKYQKKLKKAGIKDLIFPDLKAEKDIKLLNSSGYNLVPFLDSKEKIRGHTFKGEAFLYCPTHRGKTGTDKSFELEFLEGLKNELESSQLAEIPHLAGFGISSAEDVKKIMTLDFDGVIVGSEFINKIDQGMAAVEDFLAELKIALNKR